MHYIKQLDSLRAIAVLLVIFTHWFPEDHPLHTYTAFFNGVDIFFTLSGFLITRILLENREQAAVSGTGNWTVFKNFYIRRTLRIFPIYYLTITALFILGPKTITHIRESFLYFVTYTSNFYFYSINAWDGILSHLWSLAVEEQFYLIWPWIIVLVRKKYLPWVMLLAIAIGIVGQATTSSILTFSCFDGFGIGALLAWLFQYKPSWLEKIYRPSLWIAALCFLLQAVRVFSDSTIVIVPSRTLTSLCTFTLISAILLNKGEQGVFSKYILKNRRLIAMGKISYGIYLYHLIIPHFTGKALTAINSYLPFQLSAYHFYLLSLENFCILMLAAYASWKIIEQPILTYKQKFAYQPQSKNREEKTHINIKTKGVPQAFGNSSYRQ